MFGCWANGHLRTQKGSQAAGCPHPVPGGLQQSLEIGKPFPWCVTASMGIPCSWSTCLGGAQLCWHSASTLASLRTFLQTPKCIVSKNTEYSIPHPSLSASETVFYCKLKHFLELWYLTKLVFLCMISGMILFSDGIIDKREISFCTFGRIMWPNLELQSLEMFLGIE